MEEKGGKGRGGEGKGEEERGEEGRGGEGKRTSDRSPAPNLPLHHWSKVKLILT